MGNQIFNETWSGLPQKAKKDHMDGKLQGLKPVIVYLDDQSEALELFTFRCAEFGLEAKVSSSQDELLDFIKHNQARILFIFSDFHMEETNGFKFRARVLEFNQATPFFILTSNVDLNTALEGVKLKVWGYFEKPFNKTTMAELLVGEGENYLATLLDDFLMLRSFTEDVTNIISEIEEGCLHLETDPQDQETVNRIFGLVHTIKGSSGFFEPRTLHLFSHALEDILKQVQSGNIAVSSGLITTWLRACDVIRSLNEELSSGLHKEHDLEAFKALLQVGKVSAGAPLTLVSPHATEPKVESKETKVSEIKVSMAVLDDFARASGEMTVIRNMVNKVVSSIEKQYAADKDVQSLGELLNEMYKINSDIQAKIADVRRVSVSHLIKPLSRNFRDTCKALGKEVDFVIEGEEVRLDNAMADTLSRCLIHLIRNSLDHGLEANDERVQLGKPFRSRVLLKFESANESVVVTIEDDGRGINTDHIRSKVLAKGLRTPETLALMSEEELHLMIFESGFSTAVQVTEFSGRGVGMSMVKDTVEQSRGSIRIHSEKSKGARFVIEIPIPKSVQMINCLFVITGRMTFGIPQEHVLRIIDRKIQKQGLEQLGGSSFIRFEGILVPVVSLSSVLGLSELQEEFVVILESNKRVFALSVGQVLEVEDTVIKQLGIRQLSSLGTYQGATFLGDGTLGLVVDIPGLAKKLDIKKPKPKATNVVLELEKPQNVISFTLGSAGVFAVAEQEVFRVEIVPAASFVRSGEHWVMPYRSSMLTMIDLEALFSGVTRDPRGRDELAVVIVKYHEQYMGLLVHEIKDRLTVELRIIPTLRKKLGVLGNVLHPDGTFGMIDLSEIFGQIQVRDQAS